MSNIVLLPNRRECIGETVRRFNGLGFALSSVRGRLVAVPMRSNVVPLPQARRPVASAVFDFAKLERT